MRVGFAAVGQLAGGTTPSGYHPQLGCLGVLGRIAVAGDLINQPLPVGAPLRIGDSVVTKEVLDLHRATGRGLVRCRLSMGVILQHEMSQKKGGPEGRGENAVGDHLGIPRTIGRS
jgi:hypothetical protein